MTMRRLALAIVSIAMAGSACASSSSPGGGVDSGAAGVLGLSEVRIGWHDVVRGLTSPISVTNAGDGSGRLFVVEQDGVVRIVRSGKLLAASYLDITGKVRSGGEQGFLSIAFHPHFAKHPKLYGAYTRSDGALVVASFKAKSAGVNHVAASTEKQILVVPHAGASNHNGGQLFFGDHGFLYITTGDGGGAGDTFGRTDRRDNLSGKLLRIDIDKSCGAKRYCVPVSNPYAGSSRYLGEIIGWGLRNPWRASFDRPTDTVWIGDVGQDAYEEIDRVGVPAAHDFGWSCKEGNATFNRGKCDGRQMTAPVQVIPQDPGGNCAIVGGYVYRGKKYAGIVRGLYVYTDNCSGRVWGLRKTGGRWKNAQIGSIGGNPSGLGVSQSGELYAVTLDGVLHKASFTKR
jgi:glucose/arabinose dehydrogenase